MSKELSKKLIEIDGDRGLGVTQAKVVSVQTGPPRTVTVTIDGTNYSGIVLLDHVDPIVDQSVWILRIGSGRWIVIGAHGNTMTVATPTLPAGFVGATIASSAPSGWVFHNQTISNCNTLYPYLWAAAPASWKSGTSLIIPNLTDKVLVQQGTTALGATGGSSSVTIASANLPPHVHDMTHTHANGTTDTTGAHTHEERYINTVSANAGTYSMMRPYGWSGTSQQGPSSGNHSHIVYVPQWAGNTGNGGFANTALTLPVAPHLGVNIMIKAH